MFSVIVLTRVGLLVLSLLALLLALRQQRTGARRFGANGLLATLAVLGVFSITNFGLFHGP